MAPDQSIQISPGQKSEPNIFTEGNKGDEGRQNKMTNMLRFSK